jgi:hypothetical protein
MDITQELLEKIVREAHFHKDMLFFMTKNNMEEYILQCNITLIAKGKTILEDLEFLILIFRNLEQWLMNMDIQLNLRKTYVFGKLNLVIFTIQLN